MVIIFTASRFRKHDFFDMANIPQSDFLSTKNLSRVFNNTTATYKFYWFQSLLQMHNEEGIYRMNVWDLVIRMVANAWFPIHYFHLSFGSMDSLHRIVTELQWMTDLPMDAKKEEVVECLTVRLDDKKVKDQLATLIRNVPYRFLSPWINYTSDADVIARSHAYENGCLYSIQKTKDEFYITINPVWNKYLQDYYGILTYFINWNLTLFLQQRNPNIPNIPNKLTRPMERTSLSKQRRFWDDVIRIGGHVHCIYTGQEIHIGDYAVDHFLPWSFVAHDQLWNLIPADNSINSSKSDKLPPLDRFLKKLAEEHREAIRIYLGAGKKESALEDFASLGYTPRDLLQLNRERFLAAYQQTFTPLFQIAQNMGYEVWNV